jgi:hypothetical protein
MDSQNELDFFLSMISPSLKHEVMRVIFCKVIKSNPVFGNSDIIVEEIVKNVNFLLKLPEDEIIKQNEEGTYLYFLAKGDCEVFVLTESKQEVKANTLSPGSIFGVRNSN